MSRAGKKLTDEDRVLWSLVAKSAKPLKGRKPAEDESPKPAIEEKMPSAAAVSAATRPARGSSQSGSMSRHVLDQADAGQTVARKAADRGPRRPSRHDAKRGAFAVAVVPAAGTCRRRALCACHYGEGIFVRRRRDIEAPGAGLAVDAAFPRAGVEPRSGGAPARRRGGALHPPAKGSMTPLGEKLRELRRRKGVSQKEMAARNGRQRRVSFSARAWAPRRADVGAAAEDHRLLQCHLGRCRGVAAAGGGSRIRASSSTRRACRRPRPNWRICSLNGSPAWIRQTLGEITGLVNGAQKPAPGRYDD